MNQTLTMIEGVKVGHSQLYANRTGCTVVLFDHPVVTAVEVRGGWPGTFDTESIAFSKTFYHKNAIFLTGGDVFGLNSASGIQKFLIIKKLASDIEPGSLPGVVGANIYDLDFGKNVSGVNFAKLGYKACINASSNPVREGNYGAGLGATVGKLKGIRYATKGGVGSVVTEIPSLGIKIGAIVVTNSLGNVFESRSGTVIAGTRTDEQGAKEFFEIEDLIPLYLVKNRLLRSRATTIGVVVTDLELSHEECLKVAEMAHDGLARSIRPSHATTDGDTIFCASTGRKKRKMSHELLDVIGHYSSVEIASSVISAVRHAKKLNNVPACPV
jgi:L-aminopeptidase/D-esterase-like protein